MNNSSKMTQITKISPYCIDVYYFRFDFNWLSNLDFVLILLVIYFKKIFFSIILFCYDNTFYCDAYDYYIDTTELSILVVTSLSFDTSYKNGQMLEVFDKCTN